MDEELQNAASDSAIAEKTQAVINRENFEKNITNLWGHSATGIEAKKAAMTMLSTKTGMYARIPLICKGDCCPYAETCNMINYDLAPVGEACPVEAAQIELRYSAYNEDFDLSNSSFTDRVLVSELINLDIMAERCKALMTKEEVPVIEVVSGISESGDTFSRPEVSKHFEAYEKTLKKREEILQLMMATRKDKKDDGQKEKSLLEIIEEATKEGFVEAQRPDNVIDVPINEEKE